MSDVERLARSAPDADGAQAAQEPEPSMFRDPVVQLMLSVALGLVIVFLATVLGALLTGVGKSSNPRTAAERELLVASAQVKAGAVGAAWAPYVNALVATGDLRNARVTLDQARASVPSTMTVPELELSEARLEYAQKRYTQAARAADKAMKQFQARYAARLKRGGEEATQAAAAGVGTDYYDAALVKAYSFVGLRRWKDAVAMFDVYITENPTAADILIDRGNAKAELKDAKGAEKDFREALRFVPYDNEAKAGLKRIGAAR